MNLNISYTTQYNNTIIIEIKTQIYSLSIQETTNKMQEQLKKMFEISQASQQSSASPQQQLPLTLTAETKQKLKLIQIGTTDQQQYSSQEQEFQLNQQNGYGEGKQLELVDAYLATQRAKVKGKDGKKEKKKYKSREEMEKEKEFVEGYGLGFKMLQKMGFNVGKGLGKNEQGRTNIVQAQYKTSLTTRNQDYQSQPQPEPQPSCPQPPRQDQFTNLFLYKSRIPSINTILNELKNKYDQLTNKINYFNQQSNRYSKEEELILSLKIQKKNQIMQIQENINGLTKIGENLRNVGVYPRIGLKYDVDLVVVKQTMDALINIPLHKLQPHLHSHLQHLKSTLSTLYLQKTQQSLKQYSQQTGIEKRFSKYFNPTTSSRSSQIEPLQMSSQDKQKIDKYVSFVIEECVLKDKLDTYLEDLSKNKNKDRNKRGLEMCEEYVVQIVQCVCKANVGVRERIKGRIVEIVDRYFQMWRVGAKRLPHVVVFPWFLVVRPEQLNISNLIHSIISNEWQIQSDQLLNTITPWLPHIPPQPKQFFLNFYMAPKLLYQLQNLQLTSAKSKNKIKGILKYIQLLKLQMRQQIVQNSLVLSLFNQYQKQIQNIKNTKEKDDVGEQSRQEQVRDWVRKWEQKLAGVGVGGVLRRVFFQNGIQNIW